MFGISGSSLFSAASMIAKMAMPGGPMGMGNLAQGATGAIGGNNPISNFMKQYMGDSFQHAPGQQQQAAQAGGAQQQKKGGFLDMLKKGLSMLSMIPGIGQFLGPISSMLNMLPSGN
jgi:hypothetical protein